MVDSLAMSTYAHNEKVNGRILVVVFVGWGAALTPADYIV
jgi:uncharacterized protein (DUF486 family)